MRPEIRALIASTIIVVGYPIVVLIVFTPIGVLMGGRSANPLLDALWMPLDFPGFVMRCLHPSELVGLGRVPIELMLSVLGWFFAFNTVLYYLPVRLFLQWRDGKQKLR